MNLLRGERADGHDLLHLGDAHLRRLRAVRVEVPRSAPPHEVAALVGLPRLHERKVPLDGMLHYVALAAELAGLARLAGDEHLSRLGPAWPVLDHVAALVDDGAVRRRGEEGGDAGAARPEPLRERALRRELDLQLPAEVLLLEQLILADVRRDHPLDLPALQEQAQAEVVDPRVVGHCGEAADALALDSVDQVLRDAAEAESPDQHRGAVAKVGDRCVGAVHDLACRRRCGSISMPRHPHLHRRRGRSPRCPGRKAGAAGQRRSCSAQGGRHHLGPLRGSGGGPGAEGGRPPETARA
mmetsp:Transcript_110218/g.312653  ORF Transcript_110218/g.312653 Transcript_110218/m.312653 type:complete len:298 (-) Transcript_110218:9-902(-)